MEKTFGNIYNYNSIEIHWEKLEGYNLYSNYNWNSLEKKRKKYNGDINLLIW